MEPMIGEGEIPTGWCLVKKAGSKTLYYYCPGTGQHFFKYSDLIRYVEYAKEKHVGIYSLCCKSIKRQRKVEVESRATESKKKKKKKTFSRFSSLSIPKKPTVSNSLTVVDQRNLEEESRATESKKALSVLSIPKKTSDSNSLTALDLIAEYESPTASESTNEGDEDYVPESDCDDLAESDTIDEEKQIVKEEMDDLKAP